MGRGAWRVVVLDPLADGLRLLGLYLVVLPLCYGLAAHLPRPPASSGFEASEADFAGYASWPHFRLEGGGQAVRTVYYRLAPGSGRPFPAGTILVKELERAGGVEVDAMVKRGAAFGAGPGEAPGWEWFGLERGAGGRPVVLWRGTRAPGVGGYAGGGASCAGCHALARENDYVQSGPLWLQGAGK